METIQSTAAAQSEGAPTGVRRPYLYMLAAILTVAVTLPLANSSGQMGAGGLFDECFNDSCVAPARLASSRD